MMTSLLQRMTSNQRIVIVDFATCEVHVFPYDTQIWEETGKDFVTTHCSEHGQTFKLTECAWRIVDLDRTEGRLPIYIH